MSLSPSPSVSASNSPNRSVKRKPAPSLQNLRYPQPDPEDPFAPLTALRYKASKNVIGSQDDLTRVLSDGVLSIRSGLAFTLQPSIEAGCLSTHPYRASLDAQNTCTRASKRTSSMQNEPHYLRRTHVTKGIASIADQGAPPAAAAIPALIPDDGSRTSTESNATSIGYETDTSVLPRRSPNRISRLFTKSRKTAMDARSARSNESIEHGPKSPSHSSPSLVTRHASSPLTPTLSPPSAFIAASSFSNRASSSPFPSPPQTPSKQPSAVKKASPPPEPRSPSKRPPPVKASPPPEPQSPTMSSNRRRSSKDSAFSFELIHAQHHRRTRQFSTATLPAFPLSHHSPIQSHHAAASDSDSASSSYVHICTSDPNLSSPPPKKARENLTTQLPSRSQIEHASSLHVIAENGLRVSFNDLFTSKLTIVIFIRHFWCSSSHAYMLSLSRELDRMTLGLEGVNVIIIGNGSSNLIRSYRQIFHLPFEMYTDPSLELYSTLGLPQLERLPHSKHDDHHHHSGNKKPRHRMKFLLNAIRVGMPVWERGGDITQLGGEFVFGRGVTKCIWAHRMAGADDEHTLINEILKFCSSTNSKSEAAESEKLLTVNEMFAKKKRHSHEPAKTPRSSIVGEPVVVPSTPDAKKTREARRRHTFEPNSRDSAHIRDSLISMNVDDEDVFMVNRMKSLDKIQQRRKERRERGCDDKEERGKHEEKEAVGDKKASTTIEAVVCENVIKEE